MTEQKRLDRPELREKIHNILSDYAYVREEAFAGGQKATATPYINQILALRIPDIEAIKTQAKDTIKGIEEMYEKDEARVIEEAKREERERIIKVIEATEISDEDHFYLHFNTPYKLSGARVRMNAFLRGVDDGANAMKQSIGQALRGEK